MDPHSSVLRDEVSLYKYFGIFRNKCLFIFSVPEVYVHQDVTLSLFSRGSGFEPLWVLPSAPQRQFAQGTVMFVRLWRLHPSSKPPRLIRWGNKKNPPIILNFTNTNLNISKTKGKPLKRHPIPKYIIFSPNIHRHAPETENAFVRALRAIRRVAGSLFLSTSSTSLHSGQQTATRFSLRLRFLRPLVRCRGEPPVVLVNLCVRCITLVSNLILNRLSYEFYIQFKVDNIKLKYFEREAVHLPRRSVQGGFVSRCRVQLRVEFVSFFFAQLMIIYHKISRSRKV